jgi:hypothetical protein
VVDPQGQHPESDDLDLPGGEPGGSEPTEEFSVPASDSGVGLPQPGENMALADLSDFTFPGEAPAEGQPSAEAAPGGEDPTLEPFSPEGEANLGISASDEGLAESLMAGEGLADVGEEAVEGAAEEGVEPAAEERAPEAEAEAELEAEPAKAPLPPWVEKAEWGAVGGIGGLAFLLAVIAVCWFSNPGTITVIWHLAYWILLALIPYSLWRGKKFWVAAELSPLYAVMLAIGAAALLTAVYCLGLELSRYNWDIKARKARHLTAASSTVRLPRGGQAG